MDKPEIFTQFYNEYLSFTGKNPDVTTKDGMSLFMQYIHARNTFQLNVTMIEQNKLLKEMLHKLGTM